MSHDSPFLALQGNLRVCKECCEIFTEFRLGKLKLPEKANQTSDPMMSDHSPTSPHPSSLGVESPQPLQGRAFVISVGRVAGYFYHTPLYSVGGVAGYFTTPLSTV